MTDLSPETVGRMDPDLIEAREAVITALEFVDPATAEKARAGYFDEWPTVICALAAIKRGRALERGESR